MPSIPIEKPQHFEVYCGRSLAEDSPDHIAPWGAKNDNNTDLALIDEMWDAGHRSLLDLGCAQGQFVVDFAAKGGKALGLDGCGWLKGRSNWGERPKLFAHCDIGQDFEVYDSLDGPLDVQNLSWFRSWDGRFDAITAWEVLEHIPESRLPVLMENVIRHLRGEFYVTGPQEHPRPVNGLFFGTVSTRRDCVSVDGVERDYHQTVQPWPWWHSFLGGYFDLVEYPFRNRLRHDPGSFVFACRRKA